MLKFFYTGEEVSFSGALPEKKMMRWRALTSAFELSEAPLGVTWACASGVGGGVSASVSSRSQKRRRDTRDTPEPPSADTSTIVREIRRY